MEEIIEKIRELMEGLVPDLDTSPGSPFDTQILRLIRNSFGVDELDLDITDMIVRRLNQLDPQISTDPGSAIYELMIKPLSSILEPLRLEVKRVKDNQDFNNIQNMTDAEVDRRVSSFFVERVLGNFALGVVRVYYASPRAVAVDLVNIAQTSDGLRYLPDGAQDITREEMSVNKEGSLFFVDFDYVAEATGDEYNVEDGSIVSVSGLPGSVRVTNKSSFVAGIPREDSESLARRAEKSISDKSLSSANGIISALFSVFPGKVLSVIPIGFGDPEMTRDLFKFNKNIKFDRLIFETFTTPSLTHILSTIDVEVSSVKVWSGIGVELVYVEGSPGPGEFTVNKNIGPLLEDEIELESSASILVFYYESGAATEVYEDLPGGIDYPPLFPPDSTQEVHIGGKSDIYIKPFPAYNTDSLRISNLQDFASFKVDDGVLEQASDGFYYFSVARSLELREYGAFPGDRIEIYSISGVLTTILTISEFDVPLKRFRLRNAYSDVVSGVEVPKFLSVDGGSLPSNDLRCIFRLSEGNSILLERLVARDSFGEEVFLDLSGDISANRAAASTEYPVQPSLGYKYRDISNPRFLKSFQTNLPLVATSESGPFQEHIIRSRTIFAEGVESDTGVGVAYFVSQENIATGNIKSPWTRLTQVSAFNPLTNTIDDRRLMNIRPVDMRSLDLSGGVSGSTNASGLVRMYFEKPIFLILYGQGYSSGQDGQTRFTHRVTRELRGGVFVDFNLIYRLNTQGTSGGPILMAFPGAGISDEDVFSDGDMLGDFTYENGLWYVDVFVVGDPIASERSDGFNVTEAQMNLGDEAEMFIGSHSLSDTVEHQFELIEYEEGPTAEFDLIASLNDPESGPFGSIALGTPKVMSVDEADLDPTGANDPAAGDFLVTLSGSDPEVIIGSFEVVSVTPTGGPGFDIEVDSSMLVSTAAGGPFDVDFKIVRSAGVDSTFIKNPHIRLSDLGGGTSPGNLPNSSMRGEGYWLQPRSPFNYTKVGSQYTFTTESLTMFRFGDAFNTEYFPNTDRGELSVVSGSGPLEGEARDNLTAICGGRVSLAAEDFAVIIGTQPQVETFPARYEEVTDVDGSTLASSSNVFTDTGAFNGVTDGWFLEIISGTRAGEFYEIDTHTNDDLTLLGDPDFLDETNIEYRVTSPLVQFDLSKEIVDPSRTRLVRKYVDFEGEYMYLESVQIAGSPGLGQEGHYDFIDGGASPEDQVEIHTNDETIVGAGGKLWLLETVVVTWLPRLVKVVIQGTLSGTNLNDVNLGTDGTLTINTTEQSLKGSDLVSIINDDLTWSDYVLALLGEDDNEGLISPNIVGSGTVIDANTFQDTEADFEALGVSPGDTIQTVSNGTVLIDQIDPSDSTKLITVGVFSPDSGSTGYIIRRTVTYDSPGLPVSVEGYLRSDALIGQSIQIDYHWSKSVKEVQDYLVSKSNRSVTKDILARHGIPVYANIRAVFNKIVGTRAAALEDLEEYILRLDNEPLRTSDVIRLPTVADHVPVPVDINGLIIREDLSVRVTRSLDGIEARRIEVILPGIIDLVTTS